jgi:Tfp pilus assembly protein PilV
MQKVKVHGSEAGITMIETLMASAILVIGSIAMIGLIISSIASNNRNKIDSTQTMLTEAILEQINAAYIQASCVSLGGGCADMTDCAGTKWTINTAAGGAALNGSSIDFSQTSPPANYYMNYVVSNPCTPTGAVQGVYDVRWNVSQIGTTNTYLLTVSARLKGHGEGNLYFSLPVTLRLLTGSGA